METTGSDAASLWQGILDELKEILSEVTVLRYFGGTEGVSLANGVLTVRLPEGKEGAQLAPFEAAFDLWAVSAVLAIAAAFLLPAAGRDVRRWLQQAL